MSILKNVKIIIPLLILLAVTPLIALTSGSDNLNFLDTMFVGGNEIKPGEYDIKWESSSPEVTVTFITKRKVAAKVQGKLVETDKKYDSTSFQSVKDSSGRKVIKELQLGGKKIKIVFE